jgi:uncharacterized protein (DUF362 family)
MRPRNFSRREFIITGSIGTLALTSCLTPGPARPVVGIARITNGNVDEAVRHAIDLLGGIGRVMGRRKKVMLKPNLVSNDPNSTTKPAVIRALAELMIEAGKEVSIGEGSAAAPGFNLDEEGIYKTSDPGVLDRMQQFVFDELGYTALAGSLGIPLVNLHSGEMVEVDVPGSFVYDRITLHRSLADIDMLCSVPMMKTHVLATVTLGMKNLIGLYPGKAYCSVRSCIHDEASAKGSPGIAYEILDMVRACPPGLVVIDGSTAMEGDGPSGGELVEANLIIAGTNPLATDMVAAHIMGFERPEVPTFEVAIAAGMRPATLEDIEIRGEKTADVRMAFKKPGIIPWTDINSWFGAKRV